VQNILRTLFLLSVSDYKLQVDCSPSLQSAKSVLTYDDDILYPISVFQSKVVAIQDAALHKGTVGFERA
jgi:hypothetical protein